MSVLFAIFCIFAALTCGITIGYYKGNKDGYELGKSVGRGEGISDMREKYQAKIDELNVEIADNKVRLGRIRAKIAKLNVEIADNKVRLGRIQAGIEELRDAVKAEG